MYLSLDALNEWWYRQFFGTKQRLKFYRSVATLLRNGVPQKKAFQTLFDVYSDEGKKPDRIEAIVIQDCIAAIDNGISLSVVLERWVSFDEYSTIASGDRSGGLAAALMRAEQVIKRKASMRSALINASMYPSFLLLSVGIAFYEIAVNVMPKLLRMSKPQTWDSSAKLLDWLSTFVASNGAEILIIITVLIFLTAISLSRLTGRVRYYLDKVPPWNMFRIVQGAVFLYNVGVLLEANVSKREILEKMLERANPYMTERLEGALLGVKNGLDLGPALKESGFNFPSVEAIAFITVIGSMEGGDQQLKQFAEEWMDESVIALQMAAGVFKQIAIAAGGLLILAIVQGINGIGTNMMGIGG